MNSLVILLCILLYSCGTGEESKSLANNSTKGSLTQHLNPSNSSLDGKEPNKHAAEGNRQPISDTQSNIQSAPQEDSVYCYSTEDTLNFSFLDICEYKAVLDLEGLYNQILEMYSDTDENLLDSLPQKDTIFTGKTALEVEYRISADSLIIYEFFNGGETYYRAYTKGDSVGVIELILSPD